MTTKSRKRIIAYLIITVLIFVVLSVVYQSVLNQKITARVDKQYKDYIESNRLDYVFLGSSHIAESLRPDIIENSFNFAASEDTPIESYFKLKRIIEQDEIKLKAVVLELDLISFSEARLQKLNIIDEPWYYKDYIDMETISILTGKSKIQIFIRSYLPIIGNGRDFLALVLKRKTNLKLGWQEIKTDATEIDLHQIANNRVKHYFQGQIISPPLMLYFTKIFDLCEKNNISIVLIKSPVTQEYLQEVAKRDIAIDDSYSIINSFVKRYDDVYYLDYQNYFGDPNLFWDSDHLNHKGAEVYSKLVDKDLKKLFEKKEVS
ncbi:MAG: DUF1574 family protein [Nanoarchaeota archaeon]|nr:DUF1574 family protein [Nanoarchaeota archaeon]